MEDQEILLVRDFEQLKAKSKRIRVHGNGFIQLDLPGYMSRLHIWDNRLPCQTVKTAIHNHRFDFTSTILTGSLGHQIYSVKRSKAKGEHRLYTPIRERGGEETELVPFSELRYLVDLKSDNWYAPGYSYDFKLGDFHETTYSGLTATLFHKSRTDSRYSPLIVCHQDLKPDNDFSRYQSNEDELWDIVEEVSRVI